MFGGSYRLLRIYTSSRRAAINLHKKTNNPNASPGQIPLFPGLSLNASSSELRVYTAKLYGLARHSQASYAETHRA